MKKKLLTISLIATSFLASAQSFSAKYNFAAITASTTGTSDPTPPPTATGVTFGSFSAVGTSTVSSAAAGRFSFTNWGIGAPVGTGSTSVNTYSLMTGVLDPTKYYGVDITPLSGYDVTLTGITFDTRRSSTGIRSYAVRSSADAYGSNLPASVTSNTNISIAGSNEFFWELDANTGNQSGSTITLSGANFTNFNTPISFRIHAWNAEATSGTFGIDSVVFLGSTSLTTGLGKISFDLNSKFNIYPVPSYDGVVYLESNSNVSLNKIEVVDILGNIIYTTSEKNDIKVKLNLADMLNGTYFVRLFNENAVSTQKIVIVK